MQMSNNIKCIYGSGVMLDEFKDYYKTMFPWKRTTKQLEYILSYEYD